MMITSYLTDKNGNLIFEGDIVKSGQTSAQNPQLNYGIIRHLFADGTVMLNEIILSDKEYTPTSKMVTVFHNDIESIFWQQHLQKVNNVITGKSSKDELGFWFGGLSSIVQANIMSQIELSSKLNLILQEIIHSKIIFSEKSHTNKSQEAIGLNRRSEKKSYNLIPLLKEKQNILFRDTYSITSLATITFVSEDIVKMRRYNKLLIPSCEDTLMLPEEQENILYLFKEGEFESMITEKKCKTTSEILTILIRSKLYSPQNVFFSIKQ